MEESRRLLSCGSGSEVLRAAEVVEAAVLAGQGDSEELQLLWATLGSTNPAAAQTCGQVLCSLVAAGRLPLPATMSQLLSSLSHGLQCTGIVPALGRLLSLQAQSPGYSCPYSISSSQHPLISVLRSTPTSWGLVLDQCHHLLAQPQGLQVLRPVLLYLFCDPNHHDHFGALRAALLDRLLDMARGQEAVWKLLLEMVSWLRLDCRASLPEVSLTVLRVMELAVFRGQMDDDCQLYSQMLLLPCLALARVQQGLCPRAALATMEQMMDKDISTDWDCAAVLLDSALRSSPPLHHPFLLPMCLRLVKSRLLSPLPAAALAATCLQDLVLPSALDSKTTALKAELVRLHYSTGAKEGRGHLLQGPPQPSPDSDGFSLAISAAKESVALMTSLGAPGAALQWLESLTSTSPLLTTSAPLLSALFLTLQEPKEVELCLSLLMECVELQPTLSSFLLTLLTHRLGRPAAPQLTLALLRALPTMASDKGCISLVMKLVSTLSSRPSMAPFRLSLLHRLWRVEQRCYPLLQAALLQDSVPEAQAVEWRLSQAVVVRDILASHATQLGSDLLPLLSTLINKSGGQEGATTASIALQGIAVLCREGVIDMRTTVQVLAPRCAVDPRAKVLCSYIEVLALAPGFRVAGPQYQDFLTSSLTWLWGLLASPLEAGVREAAYRAVAAWDLADSQLVMLPREVRQGVKLPARYCTSPEEALRPPEDLLPYVPGECWASLLSLGPGAELLLASLVRQEVASLPRPLYSQGTGAEPLSYSHLSESSVLRGLVTALQIQTAASSQLPAHPADTAKAAGQVLPLLLLLAGDYGRPLPPLDWGFLEPLLEDSHLRPGVVGLLARLATSSRTARALLEARLSSPQARDTAQMYMASLPLLARALPAPLLGLFVLNSLSQALELDTDSSSLCLMLDRVGDCLADPKVPEGCQASLGEALQEVLEGVPPHREEVFASYLSAACHLPLKSLEKLSLPSRCGLERAARLRTALATSQVTDTRLAWLTEVVEASCSLAAPHTSLMASLQEVASEARTGPGQANCSWLLELMGQTSVLLRKASPDTATALPLLLDVFSMAVVVLSGTDSLLADRTCLASSPARRLSALPLSLARLLATHPSLAGHLSNWLLSLLRQSAVPGQYTSALRSCLPVFRYSEAWSEATVWGRIVLA